MTEKYLQPTEVVKAEFDAISKMKNPSESLKARRNLLSAELGYRKRAEAKGARESKKKGEK